MAAKVGTIFLEIKADTAKLVSGMYKAEKAVATSINKMKRTIESLVTAYLGLQAAIGTINFTKDATYIAAEFERLNAIMKTLTGSTTEAKKAMDWITEFTKKTPYQLQEVAEAFIKLKSYGLDATKDLKVLGDTASAMGKPLMQAVEALADAVNGEFERLKEFGIKAKQEGDKVAFTWRDASNKAKYIVIQNNSEIIESTLKTIWNSKYKDAMQEQSKTWNGMLSNLKDNYTIFKKSIMDGGLFDYFKAVLSTILQRSKKVFSTSAEYIKTWVNTGIKGINKLIEGLGFLYDSFAGTKLVVKTLEAGFLYLTKGITSAFLYSRKFFNWIFEKINAGIKFYNSLPKWLIGEHKEIKPIKFYDTSGYEKSLAYINKLIVEQKQEIDKLAHSLDKGRNYAKLFLVDVQKEFEKFKNVVDDGTNARTSVKGAITGVFKDFKDSSEKAKDAFKEMQKGWRESAEKYRLRMNLIFNSTQKEIKDTVKYTETAFDKATQNIYKSFDNNFFDAVTGKFHDFKDFLRSLFRDILNSIINPFARYLSSSLSGALMGAFGVPMAGGVSVAQSLAQAGFQAIGDGVFKNAVGQQVKIAGGQLQAFDASGNPISLSSVAGLPSAIKSAGAVLSNPSAAVANLIYAPAQAFGAIAGQAYSIPIVGQYVGDFFSGSAAFLSGGNTLGMGLSAQLGGASVASLGGYVLGKLGDMLFGANTKASSYGAIGAALGSFAGLPGAVIGAILGSAIGGLFGKWKTQETGKWIHNTLTSENIDTEILTNYAYKKKKSWFSSKKKWEELGIGEDELLSLKQIMLSYDQLLQGFGVKLSMTLEKGKLQISKKSNEFSEYLAKEFLQNFLGDDKLLQPLKEVFVDKYADFGGETLLFVKRFYEKRIGWIDKAIENAATEAEKEQLQKAKAEWMRLNEIYDAWKAYAEKQKKDVSEVIAQAFAQVLKNKDAHAVWLAEFEGNHIKALRLKKEQAERDLRKIRELTGVVELDYKNFNKYYEEAIKAHPTPEQLEIWNQAKQVVENAAIAQRDYNKAIEESTQKMRLAAIQARQNYWLMRIEANNSYELLKQQVLQQQQDFSKKYITANNTTYKKVLNNTKKYLSDLKSASDSLKSMIENLLEKVGGVTYTERLFYKTLEKAKSALANKQYDVYTQSIKDLNKYINFLDKKQYASAYEARYEKAVILNELRALKSPTDIMIEQLQQIADNTQASLDYSAQTASSLGNVQKNIYKLVNVQLGGRNFEEILANGIIQGIKTDNLAAVLGQSEQSLVTQLQNINAKWEEFPIANGKMLVTADFDQDGINDIAFGIDASGRIISIDTQTANLYKTIEKSFGDIDLKEVFVGDSLQSLYGDNWAIAIGDSLNIVKNTLQSLNSTMLTMGNKFVVDIDQNGTWDFVLVGDATGHLQAIQQNTGSTASQITNYIAKIAEKAGVKLDKNTASKMAKSSYVTTTVTSFYDAVTNYKNLAKEMDKKKNDPSWWQSVYENALEMEKNAKELVKKGYNITTGLYGDAYDSAFDVADSNIAEQIKKMAKKYGVHLDGYATGGYTGDYPVNKIAGVVHGQEFVVNAKTTRVLGLNKDNGGVFVKMLNELETMRKEITELRKENEEMKIYIRQTSENTKPLAKNEIFSEVA